MSKKPLNAIFVSYRRQDSGGYAGRLHDRLASRFGEDCVFMDHSDIRAGDNFPDTLRSALRSCEVFLLVMGKRWLTVENADGTPRLDDPKDWVRLEVEAALRENVWVVPVLVDQAELPKRFPEVLDGLSTRQAFHVRDETWDEDCNRLADRIHGFLAERGLIVERPPWWKRRLVAAAAAVLVTALVGVGVWYPPSAQDPVKTVVHPPSVRVKLAKAVPLSLLHSMTSADSPLSWMSFEIENPRPEPINLVIKRDIVSGNVFEPGLKTLLEQSVDPGQPFKGQIKEPARVLKADFETADDVTVQWRFEDAVTHDLYKSETQVVKVLPRRVLDWRLLEAQGDSVGEPYLMASLSAWVLRDWTQSDLVTEITRRVKEEAPGAGLAFASRWYLTAAEELFGAGGRVRILDNGRDVPGQDSEEIRLPEEVLRSGTATGLEAVLLLASLSWDEVTKNHLVYPLLFGHKAENGTTELLFAWTTERTGITPSSLRALDLTRFGRTSGPVDETEASARLAAWLEGRQEVLQRLGDEGVALDGARNPRLAAVHFYQAIRKHHIRGLP